MPTTRRRFSSLRALLLGLAALATAACESAVFAIANRGVDQPSDTVRYAAGDGLALDVYRARGSGGARAPVVVFFYGGGWQRGERAQYRFVGSRLAENGVLAIVADYRTFPDARFPTFMHDAARAVAWAKANAARYGGDPERLYLAGHSAGAQIAALLGADTRYLQREGVAIGAIAGVVGLSGPYDFVISGRYRQVFDPPSQYRDAQAINFVDGDEPPFLLIHGENDRVVEARDSVELDAKLRAQGGRSTLLLLPDAGHFAPAAAFYSPERVPEVLPAILRFVGADAAP